MARRLERLSADSAYAHTASGYRGALLKLIDLLEQESVPEHMSPENAQRLDRLINTGFDLLEKAAREMGDPDLLRVALQRKE